MLDQTDWLWLITIFKAVEGEPYDLAAMLRSDVEISPRARIVLAGWLGGELRPVKLPKGRPPNNSKDFAFNLLLGFPPDFGLSGGHERLTPLGQAGIEYDFHWNFIKKKGWHRKAAGSLYWSSERLRAAVAHRHGIDLEKFTNYMNRSRPIPKALTERELIEAVRQEIAYNIHHGKMSQKG